MKLMILAFFLEMSPVKIGFCLFINTLTRSESTSFRKFDPEMKIWRNINEKDVKNRCIISKLPANSCPEAIATSENGRNANREYLRIVINVFSITSQALVYLAVTQICMSVLTL